jgi:hypothetical protein
LLIFPERLSSGERTRLACWRSRPRDRGLPVRCPCLGHEPDGVSARAPKPAREPRAKNRHHRFRLQRPLARRENLRGRAYTPAGNHRHGYPPPSECHGGLIRTGLGSGCAYSIGVGAMAVATDGIGVETVIQGGGGTRVVAVNIDHVRSRAAPGDVHRWRLSSYGWASEKSQWACVFTLMTLELGLVPLPLYARSR